MFKKYFTGITPAYMFALVLVLSGTTSYSQASDERFTDSATLQQNGVHLLAQAHENTRQGKMPSASNRFLPESVVDTGEKEKKCMMVCARWGEECTYIERGTSGTTRSCRRTCQQFTEECF